MGISKKGLELSRSERKSKKRKAEDAIPDLPGDNDNVEEHEAGKAEKLLKKRRRSDNGIDAAGGGVDAERKGANRENKKKKKIKEDGDAVWFAEDDASTEVKKSKKDKKEEKDGRVSMADNDESPITKSNSNEEPESRKTKKERKAERKAKEAAEAIAAANKISIATEPASAPSQPGDATNTEEMKARRKNNRNREKKRKAKTVGEEAAKPARFIVFIGNLPYSATTKSITKHFASIKPKSVRHLTQKDNPAQSRGSAFVEFDGYDHMKTCLKLFHHSLFDDGISPARKINVELTAGGGGNTKDRRAKIEEKNQKLNEQRVRRIQEDEKAKYAKAAGASLDESGIHPSRRAMVPSA